MEKKKILVIDESEALGGLVKEIANEFHLDSSWAINGLDGNNKIRSYEPDLIILDKKLTRMDYLTILKNKSANPNTRNIPVIFVSMELPTKREILELAPYGVKKILKKPIDMESMVESISTILQVDLEVDISPCALEVRVNDNIVFVEVAMGLNTTRFEALRHKIGELIRLHKVRNPHILLMLINVPFTNRDREKLNILIQSCLDTANATHEQLRVLTSSSEIALHMKNHLEFSDIKVADSLEKIMAGFSDKRKDELLEAGERHKDEVINIDYRDDLSGNMLSNGSYRIVLVDDDKVVHALVRSIYRNVNTEIVTYTNGKDFLDNEDLSKVDMVLLDLVMPVMSGFETLDMVPKEMYNRIVVFTSSSKREDVLKVLSYGIKNYMIKPINGKKLIAKTMEVLTL